VDSLTVKNANIKTSVVFSSFYSGKLLFNHTINANAVYLNTAEPIWRFKIIKLYELLLEKAKQTFLNAQFIGYLRKSSSESEKRNIDLKNKKTSKLSQQPRLVELSIFVNS
jgi:hypothetical protein